MKTYRWIPFGLALLCGAALAAPTARLTGLREVNEIPAPAPGRPIAIVGAALVDGRGGPAIPDAAVVVRGDRVVAAGARGSVAIPRDAEVVDGRGQTLLPGLLDAHFHLSGMDLPALFLRHGITSVRDPGAWIESYDPVRRSGNPIPRLFLTGPHMDQAPPAHPRNAVILRDEEETRLFVEREVARGASAVKVYFRLPVQLIRAAAETAHRLGVPVVAHLEIADARDAIRAGVDGIEHVTSLGTALVPPREAEAYRQAVLADNAARDEGRYQVWSRIDPDGEAARELIALMRSRGTVLSPTLGVFERRTGDRRATDVHVRGFRNMLAFVGRAHRAGVPVVVGSHATVSHAERGWAYQREMELLVEAGMTPAEVIAGGTSVNARFFGASERLGAVRKGSAADLLLVEGDPLRDLAAMRRIRRVMLNGRWVVVQ